MSPLIHIAENDTQEGREQNRRIQIVLVPAASRNTEPVN